MRLAILALVALALCGPMAGQSTDNAPQLLLTAQRLRRLKRDRERQTVRWTNFENRVQTVPDSPERGFELALYYATTGDEKRGREGIQWALAHPCERRQVALVLDWAGALLSPQQQHQLGDKSCPPHEADLVEGLRDALFMGVAQHKIDPVSDEVKKQVVEEMKDGRFRDSTELYAACEFLTAVKATLHLDPRMDAPQFFSALPSEFLISLKPSEVEHPDWMTHIAALALVDLDPNLESSQYLQGWAMEDQQVLRQGPGVAYEFLWADPYLPGVGYQNLDPWLYDPAGRLFARSDWSQNACWISISSGGVQEDNCPAKWQQTESAFGHMTLIPVMQACVEVPRRKNNEVAILWRLRPHQSISYLEIKQRRPAEADAAGMWRLPANVDGKICKAP